MARQHPRARERDGADDAVLRGARDPRLGPAARGGGRGLAAAVGPGGVPTRRARRPPAPAPESLKEAVRAETERVERELIQRALDATGGNVTQAARKLKISRKSLQTKMKELGLREKWGFGET